MNNGRLAHGAAHGAARAPRGIALDADGIRRALPHRAPFLLLDRVLSVDPPRHAAGLKSVAVSEPWFAGHFPERMVFPGVLLVECLAQLAGVLLTSGVEDDSTAQRDVFLAGIKNLKFRRPIVPGDQVNLEVTLKAHTSIAYDYHGVASVGPVQVAHGDIIIAVTS